MAKSKAQPFTWPPLPDAAAKQAASALKNDGGLVVLERKTLVAIDSFGAGNEGTRKDEFVRFLIVSEEGVRNAEIPVVATSGATLELLEGRTIGPDGTVTAVDEKKDVVRVDVKKMGEDKNLTSDATVHFPAAQVGAVLDLHFVAWDEGATYYYQHTLLYDYTTTVKAETQLKIRGGFENRKWGILTFGDSKGVCRLSAVNENTFAANLGTWVVETREKNAPPATHTSPFLLCYIDFTDIHTKVDPTKVTTSTITVDTRGRVQGYSFAAGDPTTDWWVKYLREDLKEDKEFMSRKGDAVLIDVDAIAPPSLSQEERVRKLYRHVQTTVKRDPYARKPTAISELLTRGSTGPYQGTLLFAYLLDRAKIPYHLGLISDRTEIRFSPVIRSSYLYGFATAVLVDRPGGTPWVLMPGDLNLDFGVLPYDHQDALVFWLEGEETVRNFYSAVNDPAADAAAFRYNLEMDASGNASGSITLSERGAKCWAFRNWYVLREVMRKSPDRDKKQDKSDAELKQELDDELEDWFWYPGEQFDLSQYELVKCVQDSTEPVEMKAHGQGKAIGQANGDRWLVLANPLMAGYSNAFVRPLRRYAIWNGSGGSRTVEGELLLPAGAKVLEVPKPQEVKGPEGLVARYSVESVEKDGRVVLRSKLEYVVPLVLGSQHYAAYRTYLDGIAKMGQDRCIVQFTGEKELE